MAFRGTGLTPFSGGNFPIFSLRQEIDRLFDDMSGAGRGGRWMPAVDVREDQKNIAVDIELPGIKPEDVNVSVENGMLSVSGEKRAERKEGEEGRYHTVERSYGSFFRSFQLPQGVDESQITADFHDGVLTIDIPKAALPQPRRIQISGAKGEQEVKTRPAREPASGRVSGSSGESRGESRSASSGERMAAGSSEQRQGQQGQQGQSGGNR
jgi:HSP20 family protein